MDRKEILYAKIAIVIAIFGYILYYNVKQNNIDNRIQKEISKQIEIKKQIDSLKIINSYLENLNKKDGTTIKNIEQNIIKRDSIINTFSLQQLQNLLSK